MIESVFIWLGNTAPGVFLAHSTAAFAATESVHIVGLALVGGAILVGDLTVLGAVLKATPKGIVLRQLSALYLCALVVVAISGLLLVAAGPYKYYSNPLFPLKLGLLAVALTVHWVLARRLRGATSARADGASRALAAASLVLWTAVVIAGRWLGLI
jgi:hypothetical protein